MKITKGSKWAAYNKRFHASGGVVSYDTEQVTSYLLSSKPYRYPRLQEAARRCGQAFDVDCPEIV